MAEWSRSDILRQLAMSLGVVAETLQTRWSTWRQLAIDLQTSGTTGSLTESLALVCGSEV
jgi:hypothetical protein